MQKLWTKKILLIRSFFLLRTTKISPKCVTQSHYTQHIDAILLLVQKRNQTVTALQPSLSFFNKAITSRIICMSLELFACVRWLFMKL